MNHRKICLVIGFVLLTIAVVSILPPVNSSNDKNDDDGEIVAKGEVSNSKYLSVSAVSYIRNDNIVNITGIITNFDTKESLTQVSAVGELYDKENRLITAVSGLANSATLEPQQQTPFAITASLPSGENVARYMILPAGSVLDD